MEQLEALMPKTVRDAIREGRQGRGPLADWARAERGDPREGATRALARTVNDAPELVGWIIGHDVFTARDGWITRLVTDTPVAAHALDAIIAGLKAGVPVQKHHWATTHALAAKVPKVPPALIELLPLGIAAELPKERAAALRIAQQAGTAVIVSLEKAIAASSGRARKHLEHALASLRPSAPADAGLLGELLTEWKLTWDPALVEPIERLGAEAARSRGPLRAPSKVELEATWLSIAAQRDAADVSRLLDVRWPGQWKAAMRRINALRTFGPDPRIAKALRAVGSVYLSHGAAPARAAAQSVVPSMEKPRTGDARKELLARAGGSVPAPSKALLRECQLGAYDPGKVAVLADRLLTEGDPRGEFISIQLAIAAGRVDPAAQRRAAKLLDENFDAWTGPLPGALRGSRRFERGFLTGVRIKCKPDVLEGSVELPDWGTIEELFFERDSLFGIAEPLVKLMRRLARLRALVIECYGERELFDALAKAGPWPALRALGSWDWIPQKRPEAFPNVELLGASLRESEPMHRIARAGFRGALLFGREDDFADVIRRFDGTKLEELRLATGGDWTQSVGWFVRVTRTGAALHCGKPEGETLPSLLDALASLKRPSLSVQLPRRGRQAAEQQLAASKVKVELIETEPELWRV